MVPCLRLNSQLSSTFAFSFLSFYVYVRLCVYTDVCRYVLHKYVWRLEVDAQTFLCGSPPSLRKGLSRNTELAD